METNLSQEVLARIDALAQKFGVTVEYLWPKAVEYTKIDAASTLSLWVLGLPIMLYLLSRTLRIKNEDFDKRPIYTIIIIITTFFSFVAIIAGIGDIQQAIGNFFAPEGAILFYLLGK